MGIIRKIRSKVRDIKDSERIKLKYLKDENIWHVLKNNSILYLGDEENCRNYMKNIKFTS